MSTMPEDKDTPATLQRDAVNESEKQAAASQPGNYKEEENGEKTVEVMPVDPDSMPMQGIDPKQ